MPFPAITASEKYEPSPESTPIRIYTHLDTRVMFEDLCAKAAAIDWRAETKNHVH